MRIEVADLDAVCLLEETESFQIISCRSELGALARVFGLDVFGDGTALVYDEAIIVLGLVSNDLSYGK